MRLGLLWGMFAISLIIGVAIHVTAPEAQAKPVPSQFSKASKAWMAECTTRRWFSYCLDDMRRLKGAGLWPW